MAAGNPFEPVLGLDAREIQELVTPRFSEDDLALRFSRQYSETLRFTSRWAQWHRWDGKRWREDSTLEVFDRIRVVCRAASTEYAGTDRARSRLVAASTVAAVEKLARSDRRHAAEVEQWDSDPWVLNTPQGIVDLGTGEIGPNRADAYCTKITTAGPAGGCPLWLKFLDRITNSDPALQQFLQRMVGYSLTGSTREHALFFLYGTGANGKSVFISTISKLLGDYAKNAAMSTFTVCKNDQHPTDVAGLRGARLVTAIETEDGSRWAESKIKALTGGDPISARFMRQDFFTFTPEFKLLIAGNHKPSLRSVDEAIRRRLYLVPFTVTIPRDERDPELAEKLSQELQGILRWAIDGCLQWQDEGLNPPEAVRNATGDYLASEDSIGLWLEENCIADQGTWTSAAALFNDWKCWCDRNRESAGSKKRFGEQLQGRGFQPDRTTGGQRGYVGIRLREDCQ